MFYAYCFECDDMYESTTKEEWAGRMRDLVHETEDEERAEEHVRQHNERWHSA